jgi:hypothetical protein
MPTLGQRLTKSRLPGICNRTCFPWRPTLPVSTFGNLSAGHSIIAASTFFNTVFHRTNFGSVQFVACEFGGAIIGRSNGRLRG